jgi:hypothetical protein
VNNRIEEIIVIAICDKELLRGCGVGVGIEEWGGRFILVFNKSYAEACFQKPKRFMD